MSLNQLRDIDLEHIAEQITEGYTSGYADGFSWSIDVSIDDDYLTDDKIEEYQNMFEKAKETGSAKIDEDWTLVHNVGEYWVVNKENPENTEQICENDVDYIHKLIV